MNHDEITRIEVLLDLERDPEALDLIDQGLVTTPDDGTLHFLRAKALAGLRRPKEAVAAAQRSVELEPENPYFLQLLGLLFSAVDKYREADPVLRQAVAHAPLVSGMHAALARHLAGWAESAPTGRRGKLDDSIAASTEALRLDPLSVPAQQAAFLAHFVRRDYPTAESHIRRALEVDPSDAQSHHLLGLAMKAQGRLDEAGDHLVSAGRLDPRRDTTRDLRSLRWGAGIGLFLVASQSIRLIRLGGDHFGWMGALIGVTLVGIGVKIWHTVQQRRLSPDAQRVLELERRLDPPWWRRFPR